MNKNSEFDWRFWCRLCGKDDVNSISVFLKNESIKLTRICVNKDGTTFEKELSLVELIQKHFDVKIKHNDELPRMLCTDCMSLIKSLMVFYEVVERAQLMHISLQNPAEHVVPSPNQFRIKYGLLDKDGQEIYKHRHLTEIYYLETKPKASEIEKVFGTDLDRISSDPIGNEQPHITFETKKELSENKHQIEDENTYNSENDDIDIWEPLSCSGVGSIQFDSNTDECDTEDDMNLATLKITLNSKHNSPKNLPMKRTHGSKRKVQKKGLSNKDATNMYQDEKHTKNSISSDANEAEEGFNYESNESSDTLKHSKRKRKPKSKSSSAQHSCNQCSRAFKTQYNLKRHLMSHLPLDEKRIHPCPYCDKKFTEKEFIAKHIKFIHLNERPFICEECGHAVRTISALRDHMLIHSDYAPFECDICHKGFKNKAGLKRHMEIHDDKKHVCKVCGKLLNSRPTLNTHLLTHSDKTHKCDYCGREFKLAKTLKNHLITHTGLKPYSCDFCDRKFNNGSTCRVHKKKTHPKELAEFEASGGKVVTKNIPSLETLKAYTRNLPKTEPLTDALLS